MYLYMEYYFFMKQNLAHFICRTWNILGYKFMLQKTDKSKDLRAVCLGK
jgi:hypothetical protein